MLSSKIKLDTKTSDRKFINPVRCRRDSCRCLPGKSSKLKPTEPDGTTLRQVRPVLFTRMTRSWCFINQHQLCLHPICCVFWRVCKICVCMPAPLRLCICIQSSISSCVSLIMCSFLLMNECLPSSSVVWLPLRSILSAVTSSCTNAQRHDQAPLAEIKVKRKKKKEKKMDFTPELSSESRIIIYMAPL